MSNVYSKMLDALEIEYVSALIAFMALVAIYSLVA